MGFINGVLEADRKAPRKQRHTSHRIYERIRVEFPEHPVGESTVRRYVGQRKREMGFIRQETFVPQSYAWGQEAQIDWYEAVAELDGAAQKLQVFCMRSMGCSTPSAFQPTRAWSWRSKTSCFVRREGRAGNPLGALQELPLSGRELE